jgi:beta-lactamase regulating signal transducer with metallopeptidase domain
MIDRLGQHLTSWLVPANLWAALLFAAAFLVDRALARRASASLRIALYAPTVLRVIVPFSWSAIPVPASRVVTLLTPLPASAVPAGLAPVVPPLVSLERAVAAGYLVGVVALLVRAIVRRVRLTRALASACPVASPEASCSVLRHEDLGPMVVGLLSPRIVLPAAILRPTSGEALAHVLRHEAAHVERRDPWLSAALEVLTTIAWPVVPVWLAAWRVRDLIELACDERALAGADAAERRSYGHTLLDLVEMRSRGLAVTGQLHFGSALRARIEALASPRHWAYPLQAVAVGGAALAFAACSSVGAPSTQAGSSRPDGVGPSSTSAMTWDDIRHRCPGFVKRFDRWSDPAVEWRQGSVDGVPATEVEYCRRPDVLSVVDDAMWPSEARNVLGQMAKDLAAAVDRRSGQGRYDLCPSDGPVPRIAQARGQAYLPAPRDWSGAGFSCMEFAMDRPISFQYKLDTDARGFVLTAHGQRAKGDHGVDYTLVLRGEIGADHVLYVAPKLEETWNEVR